jgi:hypothetical protein
MELRKWPRRNDAESIAARREVLDGRVDPEVFSLDVSPWAGAQVALTGVAVVPVAVVGPLTISLGRYALEEPEGDVVEQGRETDTVFVPLAHTEGGLSASLYRGARAAEESGGFRTYVLRDRMTRDSCFFLRDAGEAIAFARWIEDNAVRMRQWLAESDDPSLSRHAKLREVETHVVGQMCHVLWAYTTGDACGPNMMTRNSYALNMGYVMPNAPVTPERVMLEANMGGDKKPSHRYFERGGHGKTVVAEVTLADEAVRRILRTTPEDLAALGDAVGRLHARDRHRGALHGDRAGHRNGRDELHGAPDRRRGGGRVPLLAPAARPRGRHRRRRHDPPLRPLLARPHGLCRPRQGVPLRADRGRRDAGARDLRLRGDGDRGLGELLPGAPRARRPPLSAGHRAC